MTIEQAGPSARREPADLDVRDLVARAIDAQSDVKSFLRLHTPDAVVVNIAGRRVVGRDALAKAMIAALASPLREVMTSVEVLDVRFPATDLALVSCLKTVHDERLGAGKTSLPSIGALSHTLIRTAGGWRVAHAQTTPVVA